MYKYGQIVQVKTFMDGVVTRRVVGSKTGTIFLCNESEFQSAEKERREPVAIGFPIEDVVPDQKKKAA